MDVKIEQSWKNALSSEFDKEYFLDYTINVEDILKMCEERRLEYIAITDHNTCKQYEDKEIRNRPKD